MKETINKETHVKFIKIGRLIMTLSIIMVPLILYLFTDLDQETLNILSIACLLVAIFDWFAINFVIKKLQS